MTAPLRPAWRTLLTVLSGLLLGCVVISGLSAANLEELDAALEAAPENEELRFERARQSAWAGDYDAALADYDRLLESAPDNPDYLLGKGQTLLWSGAPADALDYLSRAREIAPDYEAVWQAEFQAQAAADMTESSFLEQAREQFPEADWVPPKPRRIWEVEGSVRYDHVTRGADDWQEVRGDWLSHRRGGLTWSGHARQAWRFNDSDQELGLAVSRHIGSIWSGRLDATVSPADGFLPDWSVGASAGRPLSRGFGVDFGVRRSAYPTVHVDTARVTGDRYFGNWRAAYSAFFTRLQGGSNQLGHAVSLTRFYHARSYAGLTLSAGKEDDYDAESGNVNAFTVRSVVLNGRHWMAPRWAVSWEGGFHEVKDTYERWGVQIGLRHTF